VNLFWTDEKRSFRRAKGNASSLRGVGGAATGRKTAQKEEGGYGIKVGAD